jgi:hypothetical protein
MNGPIDLAQTPDTEPDPQDPNEGNEAPEPNYPTLSINNVSDPALMHFPEHGHSVIQHSVIEKKTTHHKGGKKKHSLVLKVHSIAPHKGRAKSAPLPGISADEAAVEKGMP